jgi:hypothetical protein
MKCTILIILGLFILSHIKGQNSNKIEYQFNVGTTVSIPYTRTFETFSEIANNPTTKYDSDFGYFLEMMVSIPIVHKYSLNTGVNYNYNSLKTNFTGGPFEEDGTMSKAYLSLPVLLKYHLSSNFPLSISAGPIFGILMHAEEKGTQFIDLNQLTPSPYESADPLIMAMEPIQKYKRDVTEYYATFDFGLGLQLDYDIKLSDKITAVIVSRFNYGLQNIVEEKNSEFEWRNYSFMFGLGLKR